jgi:hypothetical protein
MNCLRCRRQVPDGSVFCSSCGAAVPQAAGGAKRRGSVFGTVVLFLGAIGLGAGGAYGFATLHPNRGNVAQAAVHHAPHHRVARVNR